MGAALIAILAVDLFLVVSGAARAREARREETDDLRDSLVTRSRLLRQLQTKSNETRTKLLQGLEALQEVLALGRNAPDLAAAHTRWETAVGQFEETRRARGALPDLTQEIIAESSGGVADSRRLLVLTDDPSDTRYISSLARALGLLAETHAAYSRLDDHIFEGLATYEHLFFVLSEFLRQHSEGDFRNDREAANVLTKRSENIVSEIAGFREELNALQTDADRLAAQAIAAFEAARKLSS